MLLSFSTFLLFISYFFTCMTAGERHGSIIGWHRIFFSSMSVFFFFVTDCLLSHCQRCSSLVLLIYFEKKTSWVETSPSDSVFTTSMLSSRSIYEQQDCMTLASSRTKFHAAFWYALTAIMKMRRGGSIRSLSRRIAQTLASAAIGRFSPLCKRFLPHRRQIIHAMFSSSSYDFLDEWGKEKSARERASKEPRVMVANEKKTRKRKCLPSIG